MSAPSTPSNLTTAGASPTQPPPPSVAPPSSVDDVVEAGPSPAKKRRTWTEAADIALAKAVVLVGAHLAERGHKEVLYSQAADAFNDQPKRPFDLDMKSAKDRFKVLLAKYKKEDDDAAKQSGTAEIESEMDIIMADALSAMSDTEGRTTASKAGEQAKNEALKRAGEQARQAALARRSARREEPVDVDAEDDKEEPTASAVTPSTRSSRRRRRDDDEDEKDDRLFQILEKDTKVRQEEVQALRENNKKVNDLAERRLALEERKQAAAEEQSAKVTAALEASNARNMALMDLLVRRLNKE